MSSFIGNHGMPFEDDDESGPSELQAAILVLRRELEATARTGQGPDGRRWNLDRIRVRLAVTCIASPGGGWRWAPSLGDSPHTVDLEWSLEDVRTQVAAAPVPKEPSPATVQPAPWIPDVVARIEGVLDGVFGPPGFDSAARATVFRESAVEVGRSGLEPVLNALAEGRQLPDPVLERARHAVQRLLERGPAGVRTGAIALRELFRQHPFDALLSLIDDRWRYGTGHNLGPA